MPKATYRIREGGVLPDTHSYHFVQDEAANVEVEIHATPGDNYAVISLESVDFYLDVYVNLDQLYEIGEPLIREATRKAL